MSNLWYGAANTVGGQLWLITLLALFLIALALVFKPTRRLVVGFFHKGVDKVNAKNPDILFDETIRSLSQDYQVLNLLAAQALGRVSTLELEESDLGKQLALKTDDAKFLKKQKGPDHEDVVDAYLDIERIEERLAELRGDKVTNKVGQIDSARTMAKDAQKRVKDVEREIKQTTADKDEFVRKAKDAQAQRAIYEKLQKFGPSSDRQQIDRLKNHIQESAEIATGLGQQYEASYDVRQSRAADDARRARAAERARNS